MTTAPWVYCGAARLPIPRADVHVAPAPPAPSCDADEAIARAFARPRGAPRLRMLARGAASVAITIPDASRPCPSDTILTHLLEELALAGVPDTAVTVVIGCGLHATTTGAERSALAGAGICERLTVVDAQGIESPVADLGITRCGAPARIADVVAGADLAITVGIVEPHLYAGFSGGVKGVAIGCAGAETIAWTHRPRFVSRPGVALGVLRGNPFQRALTEIASRTSLAWGANLVVDDRGTLRDVAAGDPAGIQAHLAETHAPAWFHTVEDPADVVVVGVPPPKSDSFYQASRAVTNVGLAARPALRGGGLVLVCADLPQAAGLGPAEQNCGALLSEAASPQALVARGLREPLGPGGQRAFMLARVLARYRVGVVGAGAAPFLASLEHLGVAAFDSVDAALAREDAALGRRARVLAVANAIADLVRRRAPIPA